MDCNQTHFISACSARNILVFFLCLLFSISAFSQTIVLNTAFGSPISNDAQTGFTDEVLRGAFKRIGYKLETLRLPAERALINANQGIDDRDLLCIASLQEKYTNLVQVPEKIMTIVVIKIAHTKRLNFKHHGYCLS